MVSFAAVERTELQPNSGTNSSALPLFASVIAKRIVGLSLQGSRLMCLHQ